MEFIKDYELDVKYIAICVRETVNDNVVEPVFEFGKKRYYDDSVLTTFNTQEEAIDWAYEHNQYAEWIILPKISFKQKR